MNQLYLSANYILVLKDAETIPLEYPCGKSVYSETEDNITIFEDGRGTLIIPKSGIDAGEWENELAVVYTQATLLTFLRGNTGFNLPLNGGGGNQINYSTVAFVDNINGNDSTGLIGRFDKPFLTINSALNSVASQTLTKSTRGVVVVRAGEFFNAGNITPFNNCDVYCESGVVFTGYFYLSDQLSGSAVNFNWYGSAKWDLRMSQYPFRWQFESEVLIEGDKLVNNGAICLAYNVTVGTSNITFNFNSIESTRTVGSGFAFSWRNNCNVNINVKNYITSPHSQQQLHASHLGKVIINCPKSILTSANVYGGNFKHIVYCTSTSATSELTINGDLINESPAYLGGISAMVLNTSGSQCQITINGNIYGGTTVGLWGANVGVGRIVLNGNLQSNINNIITQGIGLIVVKNGTISCDATSGNPIFMYAGTLYLMNCSLYNSLVDGTTISLDAGGTTNLFVVNCVSQIDGLLGEFVKSTIAKTCQFTNVVSNKILNLNITNQLSLGFTVDALLKTPKF